jgi:hypothetical protein
MGDVAINFYLRAWNSPELLYYVVALLGPHAQRVYPSRSICLVRSTQTFTKQLLNTHPWMLWLVSYRSDTSMFDTA